MGSAAYPICRDDGRLPTLAFLCPGADPDVMIRHAATSGPAGPVLTRHPAVASTTRMSGRTKKHPALPSASSSNADIVPASERARIPAIYLKELTAIWDVDKRMPSPESRRAWALARGLQPSKVNNWWYRKKRTAKKHGIPLPEEIYELPVLPTPSLPEISASPVPEPLPPPDVLNHETGPGLGLGLDLAYVKKEELQHDCTFDIAPLSDDPNFGPNPISSGSSDAIGSIDSDEQYGNAGTPYTPTEPSFSASYSLEELYSKPTPGAYIHSMTGIGSLLDLLYDHSGFVESLALLHSGFGSLPVASVAMSVKSPLLCSQLIPSIASRTCRYAKLAHLTRCLCIPASLYATKATRQDPTSPAHCVCPLPQVVSKKFQRATAFQHVPFFCSRLVIEHIEVTQAWNDVEEVEEDVRIELSLPSSETETETEPVMKQTKSDPILQDPSNFSWCLGGTRFSHEGFYLGLCECSGFVEGALFKRFVGCTGPWEQYNIPGWDSGGDDL